MNDKTKLTDYKLKSTYDKLDEKIDWGEKLLGLPEIWEEYKGFGVRVAILDTGKPDHPDLLESIVMAENFTNLNHKDDGDGHSTHVGGIVGARSNGYGVIGVAPEVELMFGKVLDDEGGAPSLETAFEWIGNGIYWAVDNGADIINLSLGVIGEGYNGLDDAIEYALKNGTYIIASAGNSGQYGPGFSYPASHPLVIAVGSINKDKERSYFSSYGPDLYVMAPGEDVLSTYLNGKYAVLSGTSMASPFVVGVAALAISKHRIAGGRTPIETLDDLKEHLIKGAYDMNTPGFDEKTGYGLINPKSVIE